MQKRQTATSTTKNKERAMPTTEHRILLSFGSEALCRTLSSGMHLHQGNIFEQSSSAVTKKEIATMFPQLRDVSFEISKHLRTAWKLEIRCPNCCSSIDNDRFRLRRVLLGFLASSVHGYNEVSSWPVGLLPSLGFFGFLSSSLEISTSKRLNNVTAIVARSNSSSSEGPEQALEPSCVALPRH